MSYSIFVANSVKYFIFEHKTHIVDLLVQFFFWRECGLLKSDFIVIQDIPGNIISIFCFQYIATL